MRYRAPTITDLPEIRRLYRAMLEEGTADPKLLHYPQWDETTPEEMYDFLFDQLLNPSDQWVGLVAVIGDSRVQSDGSVVGGKPKGMVFGSIYRRPIGKPKLVGHCDLLYVDPAFRAGKGERAVGMQLIRHLAVEAERRAPGCVLEGSYVPGTHGERLWPRLGLKPYVVWCAYVDDEGQPRRGDLFRTHGAVNGKHPRGTGGPGVEAEVSVVDSAVHPVCLGGRDADEQRADPQPGDHR